MNFIAKPYRDRIRAAKLRDEDKAIAEVLRVQSLAPEDRRKILEDAHSLLGAMREQAEKSDLVQSLFQELDLTAPEGIALMSLAEALLRVPDAATAEVLIQEKLAHGDWTSFRSAALSRGLKALGAMLGIAARMTADESLLFKTTGAVTLPVVRLAARQMMQIMAQKFVFAPTIEAALLQASGGPPVRYSFDMLGEGARTQKQACAYRDAYGAAIRAIGESTGNGNSIEEPSISIKLSALHPRFEAPQVERLRCELAPVLEELAVDAMRLGVGLTVDAEEADRLEPTLDIFECLARSPRLSGWDGLGIAVQAYSKRALPVIGWLDDLGSQTGRSFRVRLVKGAYWDTEIKHAQVQGLADYPVFTRKAATDVSYLACAARMLDSARIMPQFATHNAHTVAAILHLAGGRPFEFQRLHGMGGHLYAALRTRGVAAPVRVYAPVGKYEDLLPYLIRRMLENTANSSFVRTALDKRCDLDTVVQDPVDLLGDGSIAETRVPRPSQIYANRANSRGCDLADTSVLDEFARAARRADLKLSAAIRFDGTGTQARKIASPSDRRRILGVVRESTSADVASAVSSALRAYPSWRDRQAEDRASILDHAAALFERHSNELVGLIVAEAGRTLRDAVSEVRETVDFCRYYANEARRLFGPELRLPGVTGERSTLRLAGRGVFACIAPWNFPLAIFTGQVAAALVSGNSVVAKPAEQTPLVGAASVRLFHQAGVPRNVLHLVLGDGAIGQALVADPQVVGVAFTGATATARTINQSLAAKEGPINTLIAETGGINAMFVDASALPQQVVDDVIASGFLSAGQRCSSLRHLFLQDDIADEVIEMIAGAMDELRIGDPAEPATDIGPLIDENARDTVVRHVEAMLARGARMIKHLPPGPETAYGTYAGPTLLETPNPRLVQKEIFGPVVHVTRWSRDTLDEALAHMHACGYGLTLGVHSRIAGFADHVRAHVRCGNSYLNRNMVGAVVGSQPFGGRGLSGTGPKAGGPNYLLRFATEEVTTVNLAAVGGDLELLTGKTTG